MDSDQRFRLLAAAALADGQVTEAERAALLKGAGALGLSSARANGLFDEVGLGAKLTVPKGLPADEALLLLGTVVRVAWADAALSPKEAGFVRRVGRALGLAEADVATILDAGPTGVEYAIRKGKFPRPFELRLVLAEDHLVVTREDTGVERVPYGEIRNWIFVYGVVTLVLGLVALVGGTALALAKGRDVVRMVVMSLGLIAISVPMVIKGESGKYSPDALPEGHLPEGRTSDESESKR